MAPLISSCANTCRVYVRVYVRKLYAWSGKKKKGKKKRGWKNKRDTKNRIDIPSDRRFAFPERERERERVTSFRSLQSSAGKIAGKTIRALCKSRVPRGGTRSWELFSRKFLSILGKTRLEKISRFFYIRYFYSTLSTKEVKESSFSGEKFQRNRAIR